MNILEVSLLSNDIMGTKDFYQGLLGLKILKKNATSVSFQAGETKLAFNYIQGIHPVYHFAFNIPSNQLNAALEFLQKRLDILPANSYGEMIADFKSWNAKSFYFLDNNGNILECIARFNLKNHTPGWEPNNFLFNISEMGFVVNHVPDAEKYLQDNGIPLFSKGPQSVDFSVLGDDTGLIILTNMTRGWMPLNLAPHPFQTTILIKENQTRFVIRLTDHLQIKKN